MKRFTNYFFAIAALLMLFASSCKKKDKTPDIYFSTSSASMDEGGTTTVNIELSEATDNVVEVYFESTGTEPLYFGGYDAVFVRDDSEKVEATIDPHAFIDSTGHMKITPGSTKVLITFKPQANNFPHAAGSYSFKMIKAVNANIRGGADAFTLGVNQSQADYLFNSTIAYNGFEHEATTWFKDSTYYDSIILRNVTVRVPYTVDTIMRKTGVFTSSSFAYTKRPNGNFDLSFTYTLPEGTGTSKIGSLTVTFPDIPTFQEGDNQIGCNSGINPTVRFNPPDDFGRVSQNFITLGCGELAQATGSVELEYAPFAAPIFGNYFVVNKGNITMTSNATQDTAAYYRFNGNIASDFIVYKK